ncbi:MAG: hypothetical protein ABIG39_02465 [Candidatus Micrarchaeota archaeon]
MTKHAGKPRKTKQETIENDESQNEIDWAAFFAPNTEKVIRAFLILLITVSVFAFLVISKGISSSSVSITIPDIKSIGLVASCYLFSCYTVVRKINILKTALIILIPELLIILYLISRL